MISTILCCQLLGAPFGYDDMKVDEEVLKKAVNWDHLKDKQREQIRAAGGYSAAAFPLYMKWLTADPPSNWSVISRVLYFLQDAEGDRSGFRPITVKLLPHEKPSVSRNAILLLGQIGTEEEAAAVAAQLKRPTNDVAYFDSIVKTLAAIGTEKEIEALETERKAGLLPEQPKFWQRVDECEKAIRERAAKKPVPKAKSVDKK